MWGEKTGPNITRSSKKRRCKKSEKEEERAKEDEEEGEVSPSAKTCVERKRRCRGA